jgi:uncharacterized protein (DUF1015 family)
MVDIIPFKALKFNVTTNDEISKLVSPPYDIITSQQKEELKTYSKNNIVRLILPDDSDNNLNINKYELAKNILKTWLNDNILTIDNEEAFYVFEVDFLNNEHQNDWKNFTSFIGLTKIEEYESAKVLRHEYTLSKPKEDRLNLLKSTNTNFGLIYTLYDDNKNEIQIILDKYKKQKPIFDFIPKYNNKLKFKIWKITNIEDINKIINLMKDKNILIADGHHRYETSRLFKHEINKKRQLINNENYKTSFVNALQSYILPEDYVLTMYVNFNQENIKILPIHRLIKLEEKLDIKDFLKNLSKYFDILNYFDIFQFNFNNKNDDSTNFQKLDSIKINELNKTNINIISENINNFMQKNKKDGKKCFCIIIKSLQNNNGFNGKNIKNISKNLDLTFNIFFLILNKKINDIYSDYDENDLEFEKLDVQILHKLIIENYLNKYIIKNLDYSHSTFEALNDLFYNLNNNFNNYDLAIIVNPTEIKEVQNLALKGRVMPQKSTYFYPKPCSGLVMYKMDL